MDTFLIDFYEIFEYFCYFFQSFLKTFFDVFLELYFGSFD